MDENRSNSWFFLQTVSGELVVEMFRKMGIALPDDVVLVKVINSHGPSYDFDFMFHSKSGGWLLPEGYMCPRGPRREEA